MLISVPTVYCYEKPMQAKVMKKLYTQAIPYTGQRKKTFLWFGDKPASPDCLAWQESVPKACGF